MANMFSVPQAVRSLKRASLPRCVYVRRMPSLHSNRISGTVPSQLGVLSKISFPTLSYNSLSGLVPSELGGSRWGTMVHGRLDLASNPSLRGFITGGPSWSILSEEFHIGDRKLIDRTSQDGRAWWGAWGVCRESREYLASAGGVRGRRCGHSG